MAAPDPNMTSLPAQAYQAVMMGWYDGGGEFVPLQTDANGKLLSTVSVSASDGPTTGTISSVSGSASSVTVLAANTSRKGATIFNDSAATLYLALSDTTASTTVHTVQVAASGYYELPLNDGGVYTGRIAGIWSSATGSARVSEMT